MKREIKFRAWEYRHERTSGEGWRNSPFKWQMNYSPELEGEETFSYGSTVNLNRALENGGLDDEHEIKNKSVFMQYTGLKDKNGKEIYEGDILQWYNILGKKTNLLTIVYFDTVLAQFAEKYVNGTELGGSIGYVGIEGEKVKVIGNIYENPNLIKDNK